jgi:hypothetical protein
VEDTMNRRPQSEFQPSSRRTRFACAGAALAASFATMVFIDALAYGLGAPVAPIVQSAPIVVAHR